MHHDQLIAEGSKTLWLAPGGARGKCDYPVDGLGAARYVRRNPRGPRPARRAIESKTIEPECWIERSTAAELAADPGSPWRLCCRVAGGPVARYGLSYQDAMRAQKQGIPFRAVYDNPRRRSSSFSRRTYTRRRAAHNPPRRGTLIYPHGRIVGTWYGRHKNGGHYKHRFTHASASITGNPDGSITLRPRTGRLWAMFER